MTYGDYFKLRHPRLPRSYQYIECCVKYDPITLFSFSRLMHIKFIPHFCTKLGRLLYPKTLDPKLWELSMTYNEYFKLKYKTLPKGFEYRPCEGKVCLFWIEHIYYLTPVFLIQRSSKLGKLLHPEPLNTILWGRCIKEASRVFKSTRTARI